MGPDIHGPSIYYRCKTLGHARTVSKGMEQHWTILKFVEGPDGLMSEADPQDQAGVVFVRDLKHARDEAAKT